MKSFSGDFPVLKDISAHLDNVLKTTGEKVLQGAGTISHAQAIEKATLESIKNIHSRIKKKGKN